MSNILGISELLDSKLFMKMLFKEPFALLEDSIETLSTSTMTDLLVIMADVLDSKKLMDLKAKWKHICAESKQVFEGVCNNGEYSNEILIILSGILVASLPNGKERYD